VAPSHVLAYPWVRVNFPELRIALTSVQSLAPAFGVQSDCGRLSLTEWRFTGYARRVRLETSLAKDRRCPPAARHGVALGPYAWKDGLITHTTPGSVEVGLDGEALVLRPRLRFTSPPAALCVRPPRGADLARGPRAVGLTTDNPRALLRVAAGR